MRGDNLRAGFGQGSWSSVVGQNLLGLRSGGFAVFDEPLATNEKQIPPLRIAIDEANRNAPVGMTDLICLFRFDDLFVDGLAAGEAFGSVVPVCDSVLPQFPAEEHDLAFNFAGEVEQSDIQIFHLDAGGIDLGEGVFHTRDSLFALCLAASHVDHIDQQAALQKHAVGEFLEFSVHGLDQFLAVNGGA